MHPFVAGFADELVKTASSWRPFASGAIGSALADGDTRQMAAAGIGADFGANVGKSVARRALEIVDKRHPLPRGVLQLAPRRRDVAAAMMATAMLGLGGFLGHRAMAKTSAAAARSVLTPHSSNVRGFRYDPSTKEMFVTFKGGGTYRYSDVHPAAARSIGRSKSVGKAVNKHLKGGGYAYEKVANGDMLQYFADNPEKLRAKRKRDAQKKMRKAAAIPIREWGRDMIRDIVSRVLQYREERFGGHRSQRRHRKHAGELPAGAESIEASFRSMRKIAGVAKKQITWQGLRMKIEHEPGDIRSGKSKDGKTWERTMYDSYGYIPGTKGKAADGDAIDVYFAKEPTDGPVFKIRQLKKDTGEYDEDKFMVGFGSAENAKRAYLRHMPSWALGDISSVGKTFEDFKTFVES